ncbi:MAG TPA: GNAT family N-acetyltransferase [Clostridia bacterium]|nr:GNAT family N-acetyltransferase [Clostridia bacterium]
MGELIYKPIEKGQEQLVSDMVWEVFMEFEAPDYSDEGLNTFRAFIAPERLQNEMENKGYKIFCCFDGEMPVGVIGLRSLSHVSLLFVKSSYHKRGIARKLMELAIGEIIRARPGASELTVNSSPYAVEIYRRLGFFPTDRMLKMDGIIFMPMKKYISD